VVEVLRAGAPASALYVAVGMDLDERVREAVKLAKNHNIPLLDADRHELDRYAPGSVHQGLVLQIPAFNYLHPDDMLDRAFSAGVPLIVALDGVDSRPPSGRNDGVGVENVCGRGGAGADLACDESDARAWLVRRSRPPRCGAGGRWRTRPR
jgi:23S rRNA (guanosine2251-2'-O)-methyltransferase